ncbi:MAG: ATP-binding protein [Actinomycetota bacterium]
MSRLPIRARLTAAFALAMVLVLAGAALFVYLRLRTDLDETIDDGLRARVVAPIEEGPGDPEDSFAQIMGADGRVLASVDGSRRPVLRAAELSRAREGPLLLEREVPGLDGTARVRAQPMAGGGRVAVAGQSLADRDETLDGLLASFAVGGPVAVLLASLAGYGLATIGLRPVEAMRRRAREVSFERPDERLPLPDARDEIRRLGETLNEMLDRLRGSFERERRFVADASHELRTPIAVVKTELETALRSGDLGPRAREPLVAAVEECDRLVQLAEDLLVIARSAEGELPVRAEQLPARAELESARQRFADRAAARDRSIRVDAADGVMLRADPLRLRQVLGNLVDNALRHGEGEVVLAARADGAGVAVEVSDAGPGPDPELAGRAFERFARGDQARSGGGAGLGLAIVRAVAEAHGGHAEIPDDARSTVRVWLPGPA